MPAFRQSPTGKLRFVLRNGERVLQFQIEERQSYINAYGEEDDDYLFRWVDVPILNNDPGEYEEKL